MYWKVGLTAVRHALVLYPLFPLHAHRVFDAQIVTHEKIEQTITCYSWCTDSTDSTTVLHMVERKLSSLGRLGAQTRSPVLVFERYAKAKPRDCEIWRKKTFINQLQGWLVGAWQ